MIAKSFSGDMWKAELSGYTLRRCLGDDDVAGLFLLLIVKCEREKLRKELLTQKQAEFDGFRNTQATQWQRMLTLRDSLLGQHALALASVAQWIDCCPVNQRIAGSNPSQGTCLGCGPGS